MRRVFASGLVLVGAFFLSGSHLACSHDEVPPITPAPPPSAFAPPAASTATAPAIGRATGVEKSALDTSVSACDDFYQYACGSWIKQTEIPGDEASWMRSFSVIRDTNEKTLRDILEGYAKGENTSEPYAKALGDFYGACTDEAGIEKRGTKPLEPWLKTIDGIKDVASLTKVFGQMQADGIASVVEFTAAQDFADANQTVGMIWQGGLGMPEREYYLDATDKMKSLRETYLAYVTAMMTLAGESPDKAKASAATVMKIETQLATAWMTKEDRREPKKLNHPANKADLGKVAPGIAWDTWLDGAKATGAQRFNVGQPDFFKAVAAMMGGKVTIAEWKTQLRWQLLRSTADYLPQRFVDEKLKWRKVLVGVASLPPRWKRCVRTIDGAMGEALAQPFVKKTLGAEGKATVVDMVRAIEAAMHANLEGLSWMDDPTRKAAFTKLGKIANKIAYPDKFRSYEGLTIAKDDYLGDVVRADAFEFKRQLAKIGKPIDRTEWQMSPPTVNAYYDPQLNEMVFPAGILQPPFYANVAPMPTNFGGVGMVMGHELTHGFDDEGRQFDADGNLKDWWSEKVNGEFERRAGCVKSQFDGYTVLGDLHVNGKLTLGENIADLGGLKLAYKAMKARAQPSTSPDFTPEQEFFLGFAQSWCGKYRDESLRLLVSTNPHSPPVYRVNGPVSNLPEFSQAFSCKPDAKMVRKDRCEVW